jgi:SAM-dependent methyltransferase
MASGFMAARILLSAIELDLFTVLGKGAKTAKEVARLTRTRPEPMARLLNALVGLKILTKKKGIYRNTPGAVRHLMQNSPEPLRDIMRHRTYMWRTWSELTHVVKTGKVPARKKTADREDSFIRGMANIAAVSAKETMGVVKKELKTATRFLDVGGGPGVYACEFAKGNPGLRATVLDLPGPLKIARETIKRYSLQDRVRVKAADVLKTKSFGRGYDMVLLSNVIHTFKRPAARSVVERAGRALKNGGHLIIKEFYIQREGTAPRFSALFSINMLVADAGDCFSRSEVEAWMRAGGVEPKAYVPVAKASGILKGVKK